MSYEVIVIGGGPAGLATALAAWDRGCRSVCIIERDRELGGILNQCIHTGFGLHYFKEELTGPEYAQRFLTRLRDTEIEVKSDTMVLTVTPTRQVCVVSQEEGYQTLEAKAVVLAMGCRERTRGAIGIPGSRCAGIFSAGTAQRYLNTEGYLVGKRVVILGSGDIGLIMARRMTLEGAQVLACVEVLPYPGGLSRNIVQCLQDFDIPLYLSHTITNIRGHQRVEGVTIAQVDAQRRPIAGTERHLDCDTVLLSVGLIPENELSRGAGIQMDPRTNGPFVYENMETSAPGVFACGNVAHVHDLVDFVTEESQRAGQAAADFVRSGPSPAGERTLSLRSGPGVGYTVPQTVRPDRLTGPLSVSFRVRAVAENKRLTVRDEDGALVASFSRAHLAPGEMERIPLTPAQLQAAGALTIAVEEADAV